MPQIAYRGNLSAATYPMTLSEAGRAVIIPGPDNNFDRRVDPQGEQSDAGIPQAIYLENVFPTANGYQSIGWIKPTTGMTVPAGAGNRISRVVEVKAKQTFIGPGLPETIVDLPLFVWTGGDLTTGPGGYNTVTVSGTGFPSGARYFSTAVIRGICYLMAGTGLDAELYTVECATVNNITLTNITASVTPANFLDDKYTICGSNNYLLANDSTTCYWSSTTTATDFVSSLVSGAGQIDPNSSDDALLFLKDTFNGFYVYAQNNILLAQYTGNSRYPWKFTPVKSSTGISAYPWNIFGSVDTAGHYVVESNKNLRVLQGAESIPAAPALSDFLFRVPNQTFFDYATNTFTESTQSTGVPTIYLYLNRYLIVSVNGTNDTGAADEKYTHAIILDIQYQRYGKIKLDHSFLFTVSKGANQFYTPQEEWLAFVNKQTNEIRFLNLDIYLTKTFNVVGNLASYEAMQSVLILGKFQHVRSRMIQMEEVELEGPQNKTLISSPNFSALIIPSLDGRNFNTPLPLTASYNSGGLITYPVHTVGKNVSLVVKGAFALNTVQLRYQIRGDR